MLPSYIHVYLPEYSSVPTAINECEFLDIDIGNFRYIYIFNVQETLDNEEHTINNSINPFNEK